jgi:hypothetical protein
MQFACKKRKTLRTRGALLSLGDKRENGYGRNTIHLYAQRLSTLGSGVPSTILVRKGSTHRSSFGWVTSR